MINPTAGDKILAAVSDRGTKTQTRGDKSPERTTPPGAEGSAAPNRSDSVEVSQAARVISQAENTSASRPAGSITTPNQASNLVERILQQFQEAGAQALQAQSGMQSERLSVLLQGAQG